MDVCLVELCYNPAAYNGHPPKSKIIWITDNYDEVTRLAIDYNRLHKDESYILGITYELGKLRYDKLIE